MEPRGAPTEPTGRQEGPPSGQAARDGWWIKGMSDGRWVPYFADPFNGNPSRSEGPQLEFRAHRVRVSRLEARARRVLAEAAASRLTDCEELQWAIAYLRGKSP